MSVGVSVDVGISVGTGVSVGNTVGAEVRWSVAVGGITLVSVGVDIARAADLVNSGVADAKSTAVVGRVYDIVCK